MYDNLDELNDYDIIKRCLSGDKDIFSVLVSRYKNLVYSIILRMITNSEEANDLAQEVFIKIYKIFKKYYPQYNFSTWVIRITTNHVIDYRRMKKQDNVPIDDVSYDLSSDESPESLYLKKERKISIEKLVSELPEMYKIPIVLYHQQGLSYQEIAQVTDESLSKVKNRIFRGRRMLKESLLKMKEGGNIELQ